MLPFVVTKSNIYWDRILNIIRKIDLELNIAYIYYYYYYKNTSNMIASI